MTYHNALEKLVGRTIIAVNVSNESTRLILEGEWELVIYNAFTIEASGKLISVEHGDLLVGKVVLSCIEVPNECLFDLSTDVGLRVDLSDDAFVGPEAMQLIGPAGEIIIWN